MTKDVTQTIGGRSEINLITPRDPMKVANEIWCSEINAFGKIHSHSRTRRHKLKTTQVSGARD
jgi:hypothetical protein